ncbi:major facilitator superfamily domain-containing protein [Naematelia encephala]|uniref:Major facilitator superfamily domain-containing protein n=1 Tax=Naematelia encephala TaxID=71784 RepID=A0A1Y2BJG1_9TREE|nr:major facilitator superfamily domain-containing protein [Naematelia encephala]
MAQSSHTAAGRIIDPIPMPRDEAVSASALHDLERGYDRSDPLTDEKGRKGSAGSGTGAVGKVGKERGKGLTEGDADMDDIPKNNLLLVFPAIGLVLFLAALDQTIVATALPTIAKELNATPSEYSWVGTAYMLAMTLLTPVNGRVSDLIGRKPMLYVAIVDFFVFSALCGSAKNMTWLIVARAFQGLGGGSIIGLTAITVSDIVPLHKRGIYQGVLGATWGVAAVLGPILGGVLTQKASWRWCFYVNLPTCGIALVCLIFTLKLNPTKRTTLAQLRRTFDFLGLYVSRSLSLLVPMRHLDLRYPLRLLVMLSGALLIVGFSRAADYGFNTPSSYALIIVGVISMIGAIINFLLTDRNAVIPARMFKNRTTLFFLIGSLLQAMAFLPANYLLPQMFQGVRGADALHSGIQLLPFACCVAWTTVVAGYINSRFRIVRPVAWVGYSLASIGFGLFYGFFTYDNPYPRQEGLLVIAGIGIGACLQVPMLVLQAAMPLKDMAAVTSAWTLTRSLGGSIGLAIFTAILNTNLRSKFEKIPGYGTVFSVPESSEGYAALHDLPDGETKNKVLGAFADSLRVSILFFPLSSSQYASDVFLGP